MIRILNFAAVIAVVCFVAAGNLSAQGNAANKRKAVQGKRKAAREWQVNYAKQQVATMDKDGDGELTLDEFRTGRVREKAPALVNALFKAVDKNEDGKVSLDEFIERPAEYRFHMLDKNGDGELPFDEYNAKGSTEAWVERNFKANDKDGNNRLSLEEFAMGFAKATGKWKPQGSQKPPTGEGWKSLFNGEDLSGWRIPKDDNGHWKVLDGVIDYDAQSEAKGRKAIWTEASFTDFVLHVDWRFKRVAGFTKPALLDDGSCKTDANGQVITVFVPHDELKFWEKVDSGIFLRGEHKAQVEIWCWPVGSGKVWGYPKAKPKIRADNPVGEWNTFVITIKGDRVTVELNGKTVIENTQLPGVSDSGPIGLQHHGGIDKRTGQLGVGSSLIQFRNIYVKRLDSKAESNSES